MIKMLRSNFRFDLVRLFVPVPYKVPRRPRREGMADLTTSELMLHDALVPALTTLYALLRDHPPNIREVSEALRLYL